MKTITRTGKYLHAVAEGRKDGTELEHFFEIPHRVNYSF